MKKIIKIASITLLTIAIIYGITMLVALYIGQQKILKDQQISLQKQQARLEMSQKDLQIKLEASKQEKDVLIKDFTQKIASIKAETSSSTIISQWTSRIAQVQCYWKYSGNGSSGSSTLINFTDTGIAATTNRHVVIDDNGYVPDLCIVGIYGVGARIVSAETGSFISFGDGDVAYINLNNATSTTDKGVFDSTVSNYLNICSTQPNLGDKVIVLGYPTIGTQGGLTATEGIISGTESDYYVTSAKIEHGNSGGAAILVKDNCYLGIPTLVEVGSIESLGRILKSSFVFGK